MAMRTITRAALTALASVFLIAGCQTATEPDGAKADRDRYTEMAPEELAEHLIFEKQGFAIDHETQEGGTMADRLRQDRIQETCSELKGKAPGDATAKKVQKIARRSIEYPEGGVEMGDWEEGQAIAENAFGYRVGHKVDDHSERTPGGLCINCHTLEADKAHRSGTIGPSLVGYGDQRGRDRATVKSTYETIYNPHLAFPCTRMPRLGANNFLTQEQIRHVVAYLLDPASPVNR